MKIIYRLIFLVLLFCVILIIDLNEREENKRVYNSGVRSIRADSLEKASLIEYYNLRDKNDDGIYGFEPSYTYY